MADIIDDLTAFEVTQAEKACGIPFEMLGQDDEDRAPRPGRLALLTALAWVHKLRTEPELKYVDYAKSAKHHEVTAYLFPDEPEVEEGDAGFPDAGRADGDAELGPAVEPSADEGPVLSGYRSTPE